jgi:RNA polymerase sigma-70 factor, ECF subfamily
MPLRPLSDIFLSALPEPARRHVEKVEHLEADLTTLLEAGRSAWESLSLSREKFLVFLAAKVSRAEQPLAALLRLKVSELYLACACADGDRDAIAALEREYLQKIEPTLGRMDLSAVQIEEIKQILRRQLLVASEKAGPRIAQYSGRGSLHSWLKVVAMRAALKLLQKQGKEIPVEDRILKAVPMAAEDPELHFIKDLYRAEFKAALFEAIHALSARELNLLEQHYIDGLTTYQIGALYHVHQVTAVRWLERARQSLLTKTRRSLMQRLQVDRLEYESIMRLIDSHLDITLRPFLNKAKK